MEKVKEKDLAKIIKKYFKLENILIELKGMIEGHISMIKAVCEYKHKKGILYIFDLLNNITIDIASQYEILLDENKKKLTIKLDNGQDLILTVIELKDTP